MSKLQDNLKELKGLTLYSIDTLYRVGETQEGFQYRTRVFLRCLEMMYHNAFSIYLLLLEDQSHSARTLFRNIVEIWINVNYIYLTRDYSNFVKYLYRGEMEMIRTGEQLDKFYLEHDPESHKTLEFDEIKQIRLNEVKNLASYGHRIVEAPNLRERAKAIDQKYGGKEFERLYLEWHKVSSIATHASPVLLGSMWQLEDYEFIVGNSNDALKTSRVTFFIIWESLDFLKKRIKDNTIDLDQFEESWAPLLAQLPQS